MRKNFGAKPYTYPQPVYIVAAYDEDWYAGRDECCVGRNQR